MNIKHGSLGARKLNAAPLARAVISLANSLGNCSPFGCRVKRLSPWSHATLPCANLGTAFAFVRRANLGVKWNPAILDCDLAKQGPGFCGMRMPKKGRRSACYEVVCRVGSSLASFNSKVFQPVPNRLCVAINELGNLRAIHFLHNVMLNKPLSTYGLAKPLPFGFARCVTEPHGCCGTWSHFANNAGPAMSAVF